MANPGTGLQHKIKRVNFSEKVEVRDPFTMQKVKHHIKPFMVNNLVIAFERGQIALNPDDKETIKQFEDYHVVRWAEDGRPIYTKDNEHIHDCVMLAMHGFVEKYSDMLKVTTTSAIKKLAPLGIGNHVQSRDIPEKEEQRVIPIAGMAILSSRRSGSQRRSGGRTSRRASMGPPKRTSF